ncbi:P-loop containing nucleoside triphosphate hydrolase protein [Coprinopsis sp. MPI-PUGE-AT-0042]|nr:P-loop containing nucleoside triphosphate hydrolase protein [Coprinopsis sp. MPI-PUGE-AT-0042]
MFALRVRRSRRAYFLCLQHRSFSASAEDSVPLIRLPPNSSVYSFGAGNKRSEPLFETRDQGWTVRHGEAWGVVGRGKSDLFNTLLGHTKVHPTPRNGLYPTMREDDWFTRVKFVPFRHSHAVAPAETGFYDYTAKYGALREGDDKTLGQSLEDSAKASSLSEKQQNNILEKLGLLPLLSVPIVGLSNGQMRRARIVKALLKSPSVLILDEPLTGLDVASRRHLIELLHSLRENPSSSHVISSFRLQEILDHKGGSIEDVAPEYLTHLLFIEGGSFWAGSRKAFFDQFAPRSLKDSLPDEWPAKTGSPTPASRGKTVARLQGVNVKYGPRHVLNGINWEIRQGDRWHLQGANGSGKTTLLSMLTGDHPQSYTQSHLQLPGIAPEGSSAHPAWELKHRKRTATPHLQSLIGIVSPELFDAFPRRYPGMSVWDAVQTGFQGVFIAAKKGVGRVHVDAWEKDIERVKGWRTRRCWEVLERLGPVAWTSAQLPAPNASNISDATRTFAAQLFSDLSPGEQRMVLLMRALVGRPPLVILDEVWSGMDEGMIRAVRRYFNVNEGLSADQAAILVTHWDSEVPWKREQGLRKFVLEDGCGREVLENI